MSIGAGLARARHDAGLTLDQVSETTRVRKALLEALDLEDVTIVGNDSGGVISQILAADHGERVRRLLLTNCDALDVFPPTAYAYLPFCGARPWLMGVLARAMNALPLLARLPNGYGWLSLRGYDEETLGSWLRPSLRPEIRADLAGFCRTAGVDVTLAVAERLPSFPGEVRFAWGTKDPFFPISLAERLAARLPRAKIERFDASTYVSLDEPEALATCIERFADQAI